MEFQKDNKLNLVRIPWNKGLPCREETKKKLSEKSKNKHYSINTEFKKGNKAPKTAFKKGHKSPHKGKHILFNTGRTHFKKGQIPWNYKGGISKTKEYKSFYNRRRMIREKTVEGFHTFGEWDLLKKQYNYTCPCCHKSEPKIKLSEDHIIPISKGGSDNIDNIQPLCISCNSRKHTKIIKY